MNIVFFPRLALDGIRKNKRIYYPFFITCICIVAINYIVNYLTYDENIRLLPYVSNLQQITYLGTFVIGVFAVLFLLYTNSFLTKRRRKEFGLYNVLGMSKTNIAIVLFFETLITMLVGIIMGIGFGVLFSKLAQLLMVRMIKSEVTYVFSISFIAIENTVLLFVSIFVFLFIVNVFSITNSKAIELVKAESEGEKEPKANWLFALLGIVILLVAYYLALSVSDGVGALVTFFVAVVLVIIATYLLFISFSVVLCRILRKNKKYYYQTNHFISVSSMAFRMKRNGAGLGTICILSTMVLVMISSTACLYYGVEDVIKSRYPNDYLIEYRFDESWMINDETIDSIDRTIEKIVKENGYEMKNTYHAQYISLAGYLINNKFQYNPNATTDLSLAANNLIVLNAMSLKDYNRITNSNLELGNNEALLFEYNKKIDIQELNIDDLHYQIIKASDLGIEKAFEEGQQSYRGIIENACLIIEDYDMYRDYMLDKLTTNDLTAYYTYNFDIDASIEEKIALRPAISEALLSIDNFQMCFFQCKEEKVHDAYALYGSLFFLGIVLSVVFMFATVLIIYYKQVSEGYEDQNKFEIMKKVGITDTDIKKTINSQMLTIFISPLLLAILHLLFAYPMIQYLLRLLSLINTKIFMVSVMICIVAYAVIYAIIFKVTNNTYYSLINSKLSDFNEEA